MEQRLEKLSKNDLRKLIKILVDVRLFDLAAKAKMIEEKKYPASADEKNAEKIGKEISQLLMMVDINVNEELAWLIYKTIERYNDLKEDFSVKDSRELIVKRNEYFRIS